MQITKESAVLNIREALKKRTMKKEHVLEKLNRVEKCKKEYFSEYTPIYIPKIVDSFNTEISKKIMGLFQTIKA
jgi:hypothetical protein